LSTFRKSTRKNIPLKNDLHRELKMLAVQKERDLSDLLEEAVRDFLMKHVPHGEGLRKA
jgi:predicted transcriptional regulator